jgi:hypothetical protein
MDTREAKPEGLRERKRREIASRHLLLDVVPHQDTLSEWINDVSLTPVLRSFLAVTAAPFRRREIGAIIDSSKLSQMRSVHSRWVEYTPGLPRCSCAKLRSIRRASGRTPKDSPALHGLCGWRGPPKSGRLSP